MRITFNEMRLKTIRAAQNLQKMDVQPRQVLGFMAGNSDHLAPIFLATICLGCTTAPFDPMLSKDELIRNIKKTKPTIMFCDANVYNQMNEALKELKWNIRVFIFGDHIDGIEPAESLLAETGNEDDFA